ncbi:MAG: nitroreductase, partial [Anaerolineae bacterium]|nr:nitroreductase [Anaerolineae bacterium]
MLSLERILIDGTLLCVVLGGLIMASLYYNPRLWLQDYPKPVQAKVPPLNGEEKRQQRLLMIPFLLVMFGIPLYSAYVLRKETGADFLSVY